MKKIRWQAYGYAYKPAWHRYYKNLILHTTGKWSDGYKCW